MKRNFQIVLILLVFLITDLILAQTSNIPPGYKTAKDLAQKYGLVFRWFPIQKMVIFSQGTNILRLTLEKSEGVLNNQPFALSHPPILKDGEVLVPESSVLRAFRGNNTTPQISVSANQPIQKINPQADQNVKQKPPLEIPTETPPNIIIAPEINVKSEKAILTAIRHSKREDHTRVVLEFSGNVTYRTEMPEKNKFKVRIDGCQNIFPTKRPDPTGRDLKSMTFNSGPNRSGLVITFELPEGSAVPTVETVADPFRMVLSFRGAQSVATGSAQLASPSIPISVTANATATKSLTKPQVLTASAPAIASVPGSITKIKVSEQKIDNQIPDITINVPLASLTKNVFQGRTIVIDPGHGGNDIGASVSNLLPEKEITLEIGKKLKKYLQDVGFNTFLLRSTDTDLTTSQRLSITNRTNADLVISIHVGASNDSSQKGCSTIFFAPHWTAFEEDSGAKISPKLVFNEWVSGYRFDLAKFLAGKVQKRLLEHLKLTDRGIVGLPLLPLRFLLVPAIAVEVGMLTNSEEGKVISSKGFQDAAARAITNGVIDFFNSLSISQ